MLKLIILLPEIDGLGFLCARHSRRFCGLFGATRTHSATQIDISSSGKATLIFSVLACDILSPLLLLLGFTAAAARTLSGPVPTVNTEVKAGYIVCTVLCIAYRILCVHSTTHSLYHLWNFSGIEQ